MDIVVKLLTKCTKKEQKRKLLLCIERNVKWFSIRTNRDVNRRKTGKTCTRLYCKLAFLHTNIIIIIINIIFVIIIIMNLLLLLYNGFCSSQEKVHFPRYSEHYLQKYNNQTVNGH